MTKLLTPQELRAARMVPDEERERQTAIGVGARAMAEAIYRELGPTVFLNDRERWLEAKRLTKKRLRL